MFCYVMENICRCNEFWLIENVQQKVIDDDGQPSLSGKLRMGENCKAPGSFCVRVKRQYAGAEVGWLVAFLKSGS